MPTSISNGFRSPLGDGRSYTEANDGDGYYIWSGWSGGNFYDGDFNTYNPDFNSYHLGEDWNGEGVGNIDLGDPIYAISNGEVIQSGYLNSLGNYVAIRHDLPSPITVNGITTSEIVSVYAHLQYTPLVSEGDIVTIGEQIGQMGHSGAAGGSAHLHFEIRLGTQFHDIGGYENPVPSGWVDPSDFIANHRTLVSTAPDLTANDVQVADTSLAAGDSTTVTFDIHNYGDAAAGASTVGIYLSTNSTISTYDTLLTTYSLGNLSNGYYYNDQSVTITLPSWVTEGTTYYIGVIADYTDAVSESNENNNESSDSANDGGGVAITVPVTPTAPVVSIADAQVTEGGTLDFVVSLDHSSSQDVRVYYTMADGTANSNDYAGHSGYVDIAAGSTVGHIYVSTNSDTEVEPDETISVTLTSPTNATIGDGNAVGTILNDDVVSTAPDLTANDVQVADTSLAAGDSTTVTFDIHNYGDAAAGASTVGIYLSTDSTISTHDTLLTTYSLGNLSNGYYYNDQSVSITLPSWVTEGTTYYIGVIADYTDAVSESDENNNESSDSANDGGGVPVTITGSGVYYGTPGADSWTGGSEDNEAWGGDGNDTLSGGGGNDLLAGQIGADVLFGEAGQDALYGGWGRDWLFGGAGNDWLEGLGQDDNLFGGTGADVLFGGAGNDFLHGGWGSDWMFGGDDNDRLEGHGQNDFLFGEAGADTLFGGEGDDHLNGGWGSDWLFGGDGNDYLVGGHQNDYLFGQVGTDVIEGGTGNDFLHGGWGDDDLTGGSGSDTFVFTDGLDIINDFTDNVDTVVLDASRLGIVGFSAQDVISQLSTTVAGNAAFDFGNGDILVFNGLADHSVLLDDMIIV